MKYIFIVNPISGGKSKAKLIHFLNEFCLSNKLDFEVKPTEYAGHAKEIAIEYFDHANLVVVAVGGDGTVNEVASSLIGSKCWFYIIPCGSGNGFARHNQIKLDYKANLNAMLQMKGFRFIDACFLNDIPFFNVSGVGFDAFISQKFSEIKGRGFSNYIKAVLKYYHLAQNSKFKMKLDGENVVVDAFFISFANTTQFGNNVHIAPEAVIDDGLIEVVVVSKVPIYLVPFVAFKMFRKQRIHSKYVKYYKSVKAEITCHPMKVHVDGEPLRDTYTDLKLNIKPFALKLIN